LELLKLVGLLVFPVILVLVFLALHFFCFCEDKNINNFVRRIFVINEGRLHEQYILWVVLLLPVFYFFALGFPIWSQYKLSVSARGINNFFSISNDIFWVAGLALPLGVLVARMHATVQMYAQIQSNSEQNIFVNFYKHKEFIVKEIKDICEENSLELRIKTDIYDELFPANSPAGPFSTALEAKVVKVIDGELIRLTEIANKHSLSGYGPSKDSHLNGDEALSDVEEFLSTSWFRSLNLVSSKQAPTWDTVSEQNKWFLATDIYLDLHIALLGIKQIGHK